MIRAVGWSSTPFDPANPGRLCRGRERWVDGWEEPDTPQLWRLVLSGAVFSDDSARDAQRGLTCCNVDIGLMLKALFPDATLLAFKEEGELARIPDYVGDEDQWWASRNGGRRWDPCQRWRAFVGEPQELSRLVAGDLVDGFLVLDDDKPLSKELDDALFLLTGHGDSSSWPVERFQPLALDTVLQGVRAIICVHMDKHGPAIGVYSHEGITRDQAIVAVIEASGCLAVPFAIPPMLARWDRALRELRDTWDEEGLGAFPVPPSTDPDARWGRRRRSRKGGDAEPVEDEVAPEQDDAEPAEPAEPKAKTRRKRKPKLKVVVAPVEE
jgi:hypothetical protein